MHHHLPSLIIHGAKIARHFGQFCHGFVNTIAVGLMRFRTLPREFSRKAALKGRAEAETGQTIEPRRVFLTNGSCRDNTYMITCAARTGSTMLVNLLRSHPDICSYGEIFSPHKITGITGMYLEKGREEPDFIDWLSAERDRDPIKFLYKIALDLQGKKAVCFKLKHDELILPEYKTLRDEIVNDRDFRIIHLRRENLLRRYLSHYIANRVTGVTWVGHGQTIPEVQPVVLDPHECQKDFEAVRSRELEFVELFAQHRSFSISYEEMVAGDVRKIGALLDFMGVSPRELTTTTRRLGCDDLRQVIANFEELRTYFAGSPYSKFFEQA